MGKLDRIVKVDIQLKTAAIAQPAFNILLVMAPHVVALPRVLTYYDANDLLTDGFDSEDPAYMAVRDAYKQTPKPSMVKVGRHQVDGVMVGITRVKAATEYIITVQNYNKDFSINKNNYTFKTADTATAEIIIQGLVDAINADAAAVVTASADPDGVTIENKVDGVPFAITLSSNLKVLEQFISAAESLTEALAAVTAYDNAWYGMVITDKTRDNIIEAAEWIETQEKIFGVSIMEPGALNADSIKDIGYLLKEANYFRTFWFFHENADSEFIEAAVFARCFAFDPGSETWANKQLSGVRTDKLNGTSVTAIQQKNGNTFEEFAGVSITVNGKMAAGEWIDTIRFRDWLKAEMQTRVFRAFVVNPKISFTDGGIAIIENEVSATLTAGQKVGGIAPTEFDEKDNPVPGFIISVPRSLEISDNDKANRILKNVKWTARLAGAIHATEIQGNLSYSL